MEELSGFFQGTRRSGIRTWSSGRWPNPTRRSLLDRLRARNGQTLGELCEPLEMARQSATQHLGVLEAANLISTIRRGREKLHYLNPVPLWEIQERWIGNSSSPDSGY